MDRPVTGISAPPTIGPTSAPTEETVPPSALAAGSCSGGTSRGMVALRTGEFMPNIACCTISSTISRATESTCSAACTHSASEEAATPMLVSSIRVRRSIVSATEPPHRPKTISGSSPQRLAMPTQAEESVSW